MLGFLKRYIHPKSHAGSAGMTVASQDTNLERWQQFNALSPDWERRARIACEWIPAGVKVADIGCGRMDLEKLLKQCEYIPVDVVARDHRTTVVDLNHADLPENVLRQAEFATFLGVLEYLHRPEAVLTQLAKHGITVLCSYQLANFSTPQIREKEGWFNAFTASEFVNLASECGFRVEKSSLYDQQGLYLLVPPNPKIKSPTNTPREASGKSKRKLVLSGFFGRGNAGDEALLQVQYEKLSPHFDIIISVEERGAREGFWDWYPYNKCQIIHHAEMKIFSSADVIGLHVGGGDLPFGFNGGQVLSAAAAGKPVFLTGVDTGLAYQIAEKHNPQVLQNYLSAFAKISLRSKASYDFTKQYAPSAHYGADWAYGLETDQSPDVPHGLTLVVLREFSVNEISADYRRAIAQLVQALEARNQPFAFLPFCPEDERFLNHIEATWGQAREVHWWNPRRLKQYIQQASLVVSVGRLHPLIMAGTTNTPCVFSEMQSQAHGESKTVMKVRSLCDELQFPFFNSIPEMVKWLATEPAMNFGKTFDVAYGHRFQDMVSQLTFALK
jgi:hypothetical protein